MVPVEEKNIVTRKEEEARVMILIRIITAMIMIIFMIKRMEKDINVGPIFDATINERESIIVLTDRSARVVVGDEDQTVRREVVVVVGTDLGLKIRHGGVVFDLNVEQRTGQVFHRQLHPGL